MRPGTHALFFGVLHRCLIIVELPTYLCALKLFCLVITTMFFYSRHCPSQLIEFPTYRRYISSMSDVHSQTLTVFWTIRLLHVSWHSLGRLIGENKHLHFFCEPNTCNFSTYIVDKWCIPQSTVPLFVQPPVPFWIGFPYKISDIFL